jgi:hypothetical protein
MLAKNQLEHGAYYVGECRNSRVARWNSEKQKFVYWRTKLGETFIEEIKHQEDETKWDSFAPKEKIDPPRDLIPL